MSKTNQRPIVATMQRINRESKTPQFKTLWTRRYARITTAIPRGLQLLLEAGQPGDVVEFASASFGYQIGWLKIHTGGRYDLQLSRELLEGPGE